MYSDKIDKLLEDEGYTKECTGCVFLSEWTESHPYGDTYAEEMFQECTATEEWQCKRLSKKEMS